MSILVFGGTTEGRLAAKTLEEAGSTFYYSTRGAEQDVPLVHGQPLHGALTAPLTLQLCRERGIKLIIDAAHPFASQLHSMVASVQALAGIDVIRFERIFPKRPDDDEVDGEGGVVWCDDYADAARRLKEGGFKKILALTGVQSIAPLRPLWQEVEGCHFRILDRDSSRAVARGQGFPQARTHYYHAGQDERLLMSQLKPQAILTKESGLSGGYAEKIEAARELGIRAFVLKRPPTPRAFVCVNGVHGLRRQVERLLPGFFALRSGLTTGTCATCAAVAATWRLLHPGACPPQTWPIELPGGETIDVDIAGPGGPGPRACVQKDAGDDPDVTNHVLIWARAEFRPGAPAHQEVMPAGAAPEGGGGKYAISIEGGEGVGRVSLPGLGIAVGQAAINKVPRQMIRNNVSKLLEAEEGGGVCARGAGTYTITITVPGGAELARRTFNPRLGIVGGISIVGTSGIVKPLSHEAFISSIRKCMQVARATGTARVVISSGARSEQYLKARYPALPPQAFVHYGNFIGEAVRSAAQEGVGQLTLGLMMGKAVKLAEGHLDTHSHKVTMNKAFLARLALEAGCSATEVSPGQIEGINLARQLWHIIPARRLPAFCHLLAEACKAHCAPLLPGGCLTVLIIAEDGQIFE